eukprot:TRINITY_DN9379_c0_g1_i1.p1 TRINITY_DN9379_c0_g1~~TRINITY_DN9379_c0_g1_i1.p1  ORF type:complete len:336 (+),score=39.97 TRINITY_DN9379_c0_g1_i1:60-1067(+)
MPSDGGREATPIKAKVARLGTELVGTLRHVGQWAAAKLPGGGGAGAKDAEGDSIYPVRDGLAPEVQRAAPIIPLESAPAAVSQDWKFAPRDTVVSLAQCSFRDVNEARDVTIPAHTEVVVTGPVDGGLVPIRWSDSYGMLPMSSLTHPILTLRVDRSHAHGCDVRCSPDTTAPVLRRLLDGDAVDVLRVQVADDGAWLQTADGGWLRVNPALVPALCVGVMVKICVTISFDNDRSVASGCLGRVTKVPGEEPGSVAEVEADGVIWDAKAHHIAALLPQSALTLDVLLRHEAAHPLHVTPDPEVFSETADVDATVYSDDDDDAFSDLDPLSDHSPP